MTDQELLELVQTTLPAELTLDQIRLLRQRVDESSELREFFSSRLKLQSYLTEAVNRLPPPDAGCAQPPDKPAATDTDESKAPGAGKLRESSQRRHLAVGVVAATTLIIGFAIVHFGGLLWVAMPLAKHPRHAPDQPRTKNEPSLGPAAIEVSSTESPKAGASHSAQRQSRRRSVSEQPLKVARATRRHTDSSLPWRELFAEGATPLPFEEVCFDRFDVRRSLPRRDELGQWFSRVADGAGDISDKQTSLGTCGAINGLFQLKSPWTEDSALRFSVAPDSRFKIHCFDGPHGVTLVDQGKEFGRWVAFSTRRAPTEARPATWTLTATDGGRCRRSGAARGTDLALRYRSGEMILSRGDLVLLRAPLSGIPQQVYFDGTATFYGISLVRSSGIPASRSRLSVVEEFARPMQQLEWTQATPPRVRVDPLEGGSARLVGTGPATLRSIQVARNNWQGMTWELTDATPGVELRLVDSRGAQQPGLRYVSDSSTGQLRLVAGKTQDAARVAGRHWIRLVFGTASIRWWVSADGEHWAEPGLPLAVLPEAVRQLAFCFTSEDGCSITLHRVQQLELPRLHSLVSPSAARRASPIDADDYPSWDAASLRLCPADCDLGEWQRACALATIKRGCSVTLAQPLLDGLLDDARRSLSLEQQIELLAEAALLIDGRGQPQLLEQLGTRYRQLGQTAFDHDSSRPFSFVRHAILTAPLAFAEPWPVGDPELIRTELLQLAYTARWQETLNFCGMLRLFQLDGDVPLFDWAAALAAREGATSFAGMIHRQRESWRELLVAETGRQAYTRAAELTALLESGDLAGSARWIAALGVDDTGGLIPDAHDPLCASSLPVFVQNVIRDHPRLQQRIVAAESGTAELRVQQAIDEQDIDSLRLAALQFAGTEAAVTAQRWLGDRALAAGRFARALVHYGRAARQDSRVVDPSLAAKTVFANSAKRVDQPRFTPPADYQVAAHYELPGPTGRPAAEDDPAVFSFKIDTVSRHMSITVDGNTLFVNNRFHVAAFDANTGSTMWRSTPLPRRVGRNSEWLLTPMRPLIMADRLVVRQLYGAGPSLVCLDRFSGELSWIARQRPGVLIVSDPFLVEQRLVCLTLMRDRPDHWRLRLSQFDADTGALWREQDLVELRDHWQALRVCQVHAGAMSVLVTLGGVTLCCEPWGDLRWSRRHLIVPPDTDPGWITQEFARPVVRGDVAFLCQPGVRTAECVNVETGRLLWRRMLPGLRAVVGASDKQVIIHTDRGLVAVDALTGESKWSRTIQRILYAHRWDGSRYVMCAAQHDLTTGDTPRLVWVSVEDGRILKSLALPSLQGSEPCLGPLAAAGDRLWAIGGHGYDNPRRELVELVRVIE